MSVYISSISVDRNIESEDSANFEFSQHFQNLFLGL